MKNLKAPYLIVQITLLALFAISTGTSAQIIAGGTPTNYNNPDYRSGNGDDHYSALKFGFIIPVGTFGQSITNYTGIAYPLNNLTLPFKGTDGLGAKLGYSLEYTGFVSFGQIKLNANIPMMIGMTFGYDVDYIPLGWSSEAWSNYDMTVTTDPFYYTGLKFGPQVNISPKKNMAICIYATIDPYLSFPGGEKATYNYTDPYGDNTNIVYDIKDSSTVHGNVNVSLGINFYYKALLIGIEYNWMHTKYIGQATGTYNYSAGNNGGVSQNLVSGWNSVLETNMLKLSIGLRIANNSKD